MVTFKKTGFKILQIHSSGNPTDDVFSVRSALESFAVQTTPSWTSVVPSWRCCGRWIQLSVPRLLGGSAQDPLCNPNFPAQWSGLNLAAVGFFWDAALSMRTSCACHTSVPKPGVQRESQHVGYVNDPSLWLSMSRCKLAEQTQLQQLQLQSFPGELTSSPGSKELVPRTISPIHPSSLLFCASVLPLVSLSRKHWLPTDAVAPIKESFL